MKKIDTDELRAQLDTFSPEQQRDMDRDLLNEYINVFRALSGIVEQSIRNYKIISEQIDASTAKVGKLLPMLKEANTVRVDENINSRIEKIAVKMGDDVADAFGKKVRAVLDDVNDASGRISLPLDVALAYIDFAFYTFDFGIGDHCEHYRNPFRRVMDSPWRWIRSRDTNLLACWVFAS